MGANTSGLDPRGRGGYGTSLPVYTPPVPQLQIELILELSVSQNWHSEKLDGNPFELPEPGEGELWNRDNFDLPRYGVLELGYISTRKPPRIQDAIGPVSGTIMMR
eukprot:SAG31_NODE_1093_length_9952_cov_16.099056_3_plen_106_part_00